MKPLIASAVLLLLPGSFEAHAASSDWFEMEGARVRLVTAGKPDADGRLKGMLDIDLKPGWKTYWRDPGDAGVPPTIDVSASPDVSKAKLDFPAPQRHDEGDFQWAGYDHPVALPVTFTVNGQDGPARLEADVFLGVCETICVPVQAKLSLEPAGDAQNAADTSAVTAAFAAVPEAATAEVGVRMLRTEGDTVVLEAAFQGDPDSAELFIAGEDGYAFATPTRTRRDGKTLFTVEVSRPAEKPDGPGLHYTLVTANGAVQGLLPYF